MNSSSRYSDDYTAIIKTEDGKKYEISGTMWAGGDRISFYEYNYGNRYPEPTLLKLLKSGEKLSFYIREDDSPTTKYLFDLDTAGFAEKYAEFTK